MERRIGSNGGGEEELRNSVNGKVLLGFVRRLEDLNEQQKKISVDRSQVYKELKTSGYDRKTVKTIVKRRAMEDEQRQVAAALLDQYLSALGDFADMPIGRIGMDRLREETRATA